MHGYSRQEFIGLPATAYIPRDGLQLFTESVQAVQSGSVFESPAIHVHRDGSPFYVEVRRTAFTYRSRPCILSIVRDVSERINAERLLHARVELHTREQATLLEISQTLASALELKPGLILDQLRVLVEYTHAELFVLEGSDLVVHDESRPGRRRGKGRIGSAEVQMTLFEMKDDVLREALRALNIDKLDLTFVDQSAPAGSPTAQAEKSITAVIARWPATMAEILLAGT